MRKGFMRIIEAIIVIVLLFNLMNGIVQQNPPIQHPTNTHLLQRYATDSMNMICNSDVGKGIATTDASTDEIGTALNYSIPNEMNYYVSIMDSGIEIKSNGTAPQEDTVTATASCVITRWGNDPKKVVVSVWR